MPRSLIALGSNLGDRAQTLRSAVELLGADASIRDIVTSRYHETAPVGGPADQSAYLNAAVAFDTTLAPEKLHDLLQRIETELGRQPAPRWGDRAIDLDLLLYGDAVIATSTLSVPHPRMAFRRFVLVPAAEVAGDMVHPLVDWPIHRLLSHLNTSAAYVALLGMPGDGRSALARRVAEAIGGTYLADPTGIAPAGIGDDPSGLVGPRSIQFLDRAAGLLACRDWHAARDVAISDFYFDEALAYARIGLDEPEFQQLRENWAAKRETVVVPKLLVVLDAWERGVGARTMQTPHDAEPSEPLRRELLRLAARADQGPILYAGCDDPQLQFDEITAAIAAMA